MANDILTQNYLKSIFEYRDGYLYWNIDVGKRIKTGSRAGSIERCNGYRKVKINNNIYSEHRIIFMMHYGYLPKVIDHIDNNRLNNKIENLREVTRSQNSMNSKLRKDSTTGIKGVYRVKNSNKWVVQIRAEGYLNNLGYFEDIELAELVATMAREKYHGNFANHG